MKLSKVHQLHQLSFLANIFPINAYVYEEDSELTVIDIGVVKFVDEILSISKRTYKPVTKLVLTHVHQDHVGGIDAFKSKFPEAEIYVSEREHALMSNGFKIPEGYEEYKLKGGYPKKPFEVDHLLKEDDMVGSLEVYETPGHSMGSISLFGKADKILIAGDAFQTKAKVALSGDLVLTFPFLALATSNKEKALESAEKLVLLAPKVLAVGHGKLVEEPLTEMKASIERSRQ